MAIPIGEAERERREANEELEGARAQVAVLTGRINELMSVVNGWDAIIAAKRKRGDGDGGALDAPAAVPLPVAVADQMNLSDEEEETENKTQFVRDQIHANVAKGMTPADLKKAAKAVGMAHPSSWPYGPLQRLKKSKEIVKRKGRFYPGPGKDGLSLVG